MIESGGFENTCCSMLPFCNSGSHFGNSQLVKILSQKMEHSKNARCVKNVIAVKAKQSNKNAAARCAEDAINKMKLIF